MDKNLLKKYADFAVKVGVNVQKDQTLLISSPITCAQFARMCAEVAYESGVREVVMLYNDEEFSRITMKNAKQEVLEDIKPWILARYMDYYTGEGSLSILSIFARNPEIYLGLDPEKIEKAMQAQMKALIPWRELTMANKVQWGIVSIPTVSWASKVFPGIPEEQAVEKLWDCIFSICRVTGGDPEKEWSAHNARLQKYRDWLNSLDLDSLHLTASNGSDIVIGLADTCVFTGGSQLSDKGVEFYPNIPTEEVFTAPHAKRVNGIIKSSMPYVYNGNIIEGITAKFVDGLAVEYSAEKGNEFLQMMLSSDEGAKRLGEIALVPASSPVRKTGVLYFNTLFDENAACHIAFGEAYPDSVKGGENMEREQLNALGLNYSLIHEDVMVGTPDMNISGTTKDGRTIEIFKNGDWVNL